MIKLFVNNLDELATEQFDKCIEHPAFRKGALMPDAHGGYDAPIGSVLALKDWVVPSWVGYDIGCGMCAVRTKLHKKGVQDNAEKIHKKIHELVPCGNSYHQEINKTYIFNRNSEAIREGFAERKVLEQFGTLGGGNHFLELGYDEQDRVWLVIHSGSRGIGHQIASYWMKKQKEETNNLGWYSKSKEGTQYIADMNQCLNFAVENRKYMAELVEEALRSVLGVGFIFDWDSLINRNHNHMDISHGYCIHRKGATHAEDGMMGVIPANMRDGSFIVKGLGNPDALWSSSHGAGRLMSRKQAKENITMEKFIADMEGIVGDVKEKTLDEAPDAYKDINEVIKIQIDYEMLKVLHHIKPLVNIKG